jgi:membrane-associated phospholipid phosphatase
LDRWIFISFNLRGYHARWLDRGMGCVTQLGNLVTAILLAGLLFLLNQHGLAIEIILGTFALLWLVETIKLLTDRARPYHSLEEARVIGWRERGLSFPSGHTAQTFFLMTLLIHQWHLSALTATLLFAMAALVGFSRIYVGAHYPRDVVGGAILGSLWGILAALADPNWFGGT